MQSVEQTRLRASHPGRLVPEDASAAAAPYRGRMGFGFGTRFFVLFLMGLLWLAPAWWEPRFYAALALWDALVLVAWAFDFARLPQPGRLELRRSWTSPASFGMPSRVTLSLTNRGASVVLAEAVDDVPLALAPAPPILEYRAGPGATLEQTYEIQPVERGDATLGGIFLRYQSPLRIAERWAAADLSQTVRVYPSLEDAGRQNLFLIRNRQAELQRRLKRQRGLGRDFESLREHREGDEWRDICWTATARRAHLVTKVYQVERSQVVWLVVDAGRLMRARVGVPSKLDCAVNAALSLAHVALASGDRVGLLAYGRRIQQRLAPGRGTAHLRAMADRLALVAAESSEADHGRAAEVLLGAQKRRSLIVWLTDLSETPATPDVVENALQMSGRHLVLFGLMAQPELAAVASENPENVGEMYRHVAALEITHRRDLLMRRMRQQGVLAVELDPRHLSTALINHYLEIKERNML